MTRFAVVAYPSLSEDDRRWIEGIRARHDPLALRIAAHVTLVFPADVGEATVVVAQVGTALRFSAPIPVVLGRAAVTPNPIDGGYCVALLAEEGRSELLALHEALYDGVLSPHRRPDIPFVPHVTVGAHAQRDECDRLASQLNAEGRRVQARIDGVDVVAVSASLVRTVAEIRLGPGVA